jgi:hypothetical protein
LVRNRATETKRDRNHWCSTRIMNSNKVPMKRRHCQYIEIPIVVWTVARANLW